MRGAGSSGPRHDAIAVDMIASTLGGLLTPHDEDGLVGECCQVGEAIKRFRVRCSLPLQQAVDAPQRADLFLAPRSRIPAIHVAEGPTFGVCVVRLAKLNVTLGRSIVSVGLRFAPQSPALERIQYR